MGRKKKDLSKAQELLKDIFATDFDTKQKMEIQNEIVKYALENYKEQTNLSFNLFVKDTSVIQWKTKEHFTKVFNDEIKYIIKEYGLSKGERDLLNSLPPFLLWQTNLLVHDETKEPLNQQKLAKCIGINRTTIYRNIKGLIDKKIIYEFQHGKDKYYLINPYIMYAGSEINKGLLYLFDGLGYIDRTKYDKSNKK